MPKHLGLNDADAMRIGMTEMRSDMLADAVRFVFSFKQLLVNTHFL